MSAVASPLYRPLSRHRTAAARRASADRSPRAARSSTYRTSPSSERPLTFALAFRRAYAASSMFRIVICATGFSRSLPTPPSVSDSILQSKLQAFDAAGKPCQTCRLGRAGEFPSMRRLQGWCTAGLALLLGGCAAGAISEHRSVFYAPHLVQYAARDGLFPVVVRGNPTGLAKDVDGKRKLDISGNRKLNTLGVGAYPQAGVGLGGAVGNWLGDATADESGGDKPVIHSGRAARLPFWPATTTRPSCGADPSRPAAGSDDRASCNCSRGC